MGPHLGCGDALCASGCSFSYRCRARVSLVMDPRVPTRYRWSFSHRWVRVKTEHLACGEDVRAVILPFRRRSQSSLPLNQSISK